MAAMPAAVRLTVFCQHSNLATSVSASGNASRRRGKHVTASPREQSPSKCRTTVSAAAVDAPPACVQDIDFSSSKTQGITSPESQLAMRMLESQWSLDFVDERVIDAREASASADDRPRSDAVKLIRKSRGRERASALKVEQKSNSQTSATNKDLTAKSATDEVAGISAVSGEVKLSAAQSRKGMSHGSIRPRRHATISFEAHSTEILPARAIESNSSRPACSEDDAREGTLLRDYGSHSAPEVDWGVKLPALSKEDEWFLATCIQRGKVCNCLGQHGVVKVVSPVTFSLINCGASSLYACSQLRSLADYLH